MSVEFHLSDRGYQSLTVGSMVLFLAYNVDDLPGIVQELAEAVGKREELTGVVLLANRDETPIPEMFSVEILQPRRIAILLTNGDLIREGTDIAMRTDESIREAVERVEAFGQIARERVQKVQRAQKSREPSFG